MKRPSPLLRLIGLVLALGLLPGWGEVVENIDHVLHSGHLAHAADHGAAPDAAPRRPAPEHGCTPLSHVCACHASVMAVPRLAAAGVESPREGLRRRVRECPERPASVVEAPPTPPPIA